MERRTAMWKHLIIFIPKNEIEDTFKIAAPIFGEWYQWAHVQKSGRQLDLRQAGKRDERKIKVLPWTNTLLNAKNYLALFHWKFDEKPRKHFLGLKWNGSELSFKMARLR